MPRNIAENLNRLNRAHDGTNVTDRQTDDRQAGDSIANVNVSSLKMLQITS